MMDSAKKTKLISTPSQAAQLSLRILDEAVILQPLVNVRNTCFLNAPLHFIKATPPFSSIVTSNWTQIKNQLADSPIASELLQSFFIDDKRVSPNLIHLGLRELFENHGSDTMKRWAQKIMKDPYEQEQYGGDETLRFLLQLFAKIGNADLSFLKFRTKLTVKCKCQKLNTMEEEEYLWDLDTDHTVTFQQDLSKLNGTRAVFCSACDKHVVSAELSIEHQPCSNTQVLLIDTNRTRDLHRDIRVPEVLGGFRLHGVLNWIGDDIDSGHYSVYVSANPPQTEGPRSSSRSNTPSWYDIDMESLTKSSRDRYAPVESNTRNAPVKSNTSASMLVYVKDGSIVQDGSLDSSRNALPDVQTKQHAKGSNSKLDYFTLKSMSRFDHKVTFALLGSSPDVYYIPEAFDVWKTIYPDDPQYQYLKISNCGCRRRREYCCNEGKL
jgi:hypothetical protein